VRPAHVDVALSQQIARIALRVNVGVARRGPT
jgi:hypothetical protein